MNAKKDKFIGRHKYKVQNKQNMNKKNRIILRWMEIMFNTPEISCPFLLNLFQSIFPFAA